MRQLKETTKLTIWEAESTLADIAKDLNKLVGLLLISEDVSVANPIMLSVCQSAQFAEQAVVQIKNSQQGQISQSKIAMPQMMPPVGRRN